MAIVGFNFLKFNVERTAAIKGKLSINSNVMITEVKEVDVNLGTKDNKGLLVKFAYVCQYGPKIGKIELEGDVISLEDAEVVKKAAESWKKNKTFDKVLTQKILSHVLNKATVQAIILGKDVGLPAPIPMPKVTGGKAPAKK